MKVAEIELSKVDNKTKLETMLQEEAAIRQDTEDREMERLADAAEKAARVCVCKPKTFYINHTVQS